MIPIKQTRLYEGTQHGNCMRACLASLFEVDIDEIEPFEEYFDDVDENKWCDIFLKEIDRLGYEYEGSCEIDNIDGYTGVDGYLMVGGKSPRYPNGIGHSCIWSIWKNAIVHDPHPDNTGLTNITEVYLIKRK